MLDSEDVFAPLALMHWGGSWCASEALPGDDDEEWNSIAGSGPSDPGSASCAP